MIKKISLSDIKKYHPVVLGLDNYHASKLSVEAIYHLPLLNTRCEVASYGIKMQVETTCLMKW